MSYGKYILSSLMIALKRMDSRARCDASCAVLFGFRGEIGPMIRVKTPAHVMRDCPDEHRRQVVTTVGQNHKDKGITYIQFDHTIDCAANVCTQHVSLSRCSLIPILRRCLCDGIIRHDHGPCLFPAMAPVNSPSAPFAARERWKSHQAAATAIATAYACSDSANFVPCLQSLRFLKPDQPSAFLPARIAWKSDIQIDIDI
jgi:hypothetical protein